MNPLRVPDPRGAEFSQRVEQVGLVEALGRCGHHDADYFRHGVSSRVFSTVDYRAWVRIGAWIRRKHGRRLSWREVQRRFCDQGWRFAHNGVTFHGAASVAVTRYRYRGARIPTPWTITVATA